MKAGFFKHPSALVESTAIGAGTRIWAFAHVLRGARLGRHCNIGDHCFVEGGARIGDNVTIKNGVAIWEGIVVRDNAFVGPFAVFTNDLAPRSPRFPAAARRYLLHLEEISGVRVSSIGVGPGREATIVRHALLD